MVGKYIKIAKFLSHIQSYTFRKHHPDYRPGSLYSFSYDLKLSHLGSFLVLNCVFEEEIAIRCLQDTSYSPFWWWGNGGEDTFSWWGRNIVNFSRFFVLLVNT